MSIQEKASNVVSNLLREQEKREEQIMRDMPEVVFSDIFEIQLADRTKVRGCFALWKRTRHILALAFDYSMCAGLVVSTIDVLQFSMPRMIFHSDQGSQYGAGQTLAALLEKGFIRLMSQVGTPTDNGYAERFVGLFKQAVADRRCYQTLGQFLQAAEDWTNFYNHLSYTRG
jgi:putative transposase